jgi:hypothetical protein
MASCHDPVMQQLFKISSEIGEVKQLAVMNKEAIHDGRDDIKQQFKAVDARIVWLEGRFTTLKFIERFLGGAAALLLAVLAHQLPWFESFLKHLKGT